MPGCEHRTLGPVRPGGGRQPPRDPPLPGALGAFLRAFWLGHHSAHWLPLGQVQGGFPLSGPSFSLAHGALTPLSTRWAPKWSCLSATMPLPYAGSLSPVGI